MSDSESSSTGSLQLPLSGVTAIIQQTLANRMQEGGAKRSYTFNEEARLLITACATELIELLASEANEMSMKAKSSRIMPQHLIQALEELDYAHYVPQIKELMDEQTAEAKAAPRKNNKRKLESSGKSMDELLNKQKEMFEKAKLKMVQKINQMPQAAGGTGPAHL